MVMRFLELHVPLFRIREKIIIMLTTQNITICICTFRREHITETLLSLKQIVTQPDWVITVIVADNDDTPTAKDRVAQAASAIPFPVHYIHAPARNISIARNACLKAATGDFIAFIDDDELASPQWISALMAQMKHNNVVAVLGPVDAVHSDASPPWMVEGHFHDTRPVWVNGVIVTGYTCNVLFRKSAIDALNLTFRPELGRTGGEDTVFLSTLYQNGGMISYAEDAVLYEPVPKTRASLMWLLKRRFRSGQTHGLLLMEKKGDTILNRLSCSCIAAMKAIICFVLAIVTVFSTPRMVKSLLRGALHIGVIAKLLGQKELVQYG